MSTEPSNSVLDTDGHFLIVGDSASNIGFRSFLSFDLSSVPESIGEGALEGARLHVYKREVVGSPYLSLIPCEGDPQLCPVSASIALEHVNYGPSLDGGDYNIPRLADLGALDRHTSPKSGYLEADVLSAVRDDLNRRSERSNRSQYRLSFPLETDNDDANDFVGFLSGMADSNKPELRLTYLVP